jgi:hypothetical protein
MPLPYRLGSHGPEILSWQKWFKRYASSYAPPIDGYYGSDEAKAVSEMRRRLKMPPGDFDAALCCARRLRLRARARDSARPDIRLPWHRRHHRRGHRFARLSATRPARRGNQHAVRPDNGRDSRWRNRRRHRRQEHVEIDHRRLRSVQSRLPAPLPRQREPENLHHGLLGRRDLRADVPRLDTHQLPTVLRRVSHLR